MIRFRLSSKFKVDSLSSKRGVIGRSHILGTYVVQELFTCCCQPAPKRGQLKYDMIDEGDEEYE